MAETLCQCGCGGPTWGALARFALGHNIRTGKPKRYPGMGLGHGKADALHRIRAAKALGRPLPPGAEVHHVDGSMNPNAPLVICQDSAYHNFLHYRTRVVRAGHNPDTHRKCSRCKEYKPLAAFCKRKANIGMGLASYCRPCWSQQKGFSNVRPSVTVWVSV